MMRSDDELMKVLVNDRGIVKIVLALKDNDVETANLLRMVGGYLHNDLERAHKQGFIKRIKVAQEGRGHYKVVNRLAERGKALVKLAERYAE